MVTAMEEREDMFAGHLELRRDKQGGQGAMFAGAQVDMFKAWISASAEGKSMGWQTVAIS